MTSPQALSAMADWVAAIADNLKNPIASIGSVLERIDERRADEAFVGASIAQVRRRLAALNEYVSELASFASPAQLLGPSPTRLNQVVDNAVKAADLPSGCLLELHVGADLTIMADSVKLELALKALLRNAIEAVEPEVRPHLVITAQRQPGQILVLTLEDNGHGLGHVDPLQAMTPFFTTKEAGTGLGLTIARKYVEAHGGTLTLGQSPTLGGCRAVVVLPAAPVTKEFRA